MHRFQVVLGYLLHSNDNVQYQVHFFHPKIIILLQLIPHNCSPGKILVGIRVTFSQL